MYFILHFLSYHFEIMIKEIKDTYQILSKPSEGEYKEKGSKFLAYAYPVRSIEEVEYYQAEVKDIDRDFRVVDAANGLDDLLVSRVIGARFGDQRFAFGNGLGNGVGHAVFPARQRASGTNIGRTGRGR